MVCMVLIALLNKFIMTMDLDLSRLVQGRPSFKKKIVLGEVKNKNKNFGGAFIYGEGEY